MAKVEISSPPTSPYGAGQLQLQNRVQMTSTLTPVTDDLNTTSPLKLSTNLVQVVSTLRITTADNPYIDAEDSAGNNRFTIGRDPSSQIVNVDFASNPTGLTNQVGAIRTYTDGVNLSDVMSFRKDGNVGIGTTAPLEKLHVNGKGIFGVGTAGNSYVKIEDGSFGGKIARITFNDFDGGTSTRGGWLELGTYSGQIRYGLYNPFFIGNFSNPYKFYIKDGSDNVIISQGNVVPTDSGGLLQIKGTGSTSATTSLLVQNSAASPALTIKDDKASTFNGNVTIGSNSEIDANSRSLFINGGFGNTSNDKVLLYLSAWNNVAYGVGSKQWIYFGGGGDATSSKIGGINLGNNNYESGLVFNTTSGGGDNEVMRITNSKNVGIGTSYPSAKLQVLGSGSTSATTSLLVQNSSGNRLLEQKDNGWLYIGNTATDTGVIYVPHSPTYADRVFMRIDGGFPLFSTISNALLEISCAQFYTQGDMTLRNPNTGIRGNSANNINNSSIQLSTSINAYNGTSQNDACSLVYIENRGTTLQAAGSINWLKMDGNVYEAGGGGNKWCTGIYYNPSFTGGTLLANSHYCYHATSGQMMVNTISPNASAQLQVDSTTRGFLPPRMTDAEVRAIVSPAIGLMAYNTTLDCPVFYSAAGWRKVSHSVM